MRTYSIIDYPKKVKEYFEFLISEYGYNLVDEAEETFSFINVYEKNDIRVRLVYEIRDNFYYFVFIRGKSTVYPNDNDRENIKAFYRLFEKYEPALDFKRLLPDDNQYLDALKLNADLLKKYGGEILRGKEWLENNE